jgi:hypothetical protein
LDDFQYLDVKSGILLSKKTLESIYGESSARRPPSWKSRTVYTISHFFSLGWHEAPALTLRSTRSGEVKF